MRFLIYVIEINFEFLNSSPLSLNQMIQKYWMFRILYWTYCCIFNGL